MADNNRGAETIKILLMGATGAGKSAFGNFILNKFKKEEQPFKVKVGLVHGTTEAKADRVIFNDKEIVVVDTPGLQDAAEGQRDEDTFKDIIKGIVLTGDGVSAVVFVQNMSQRFTESDEKILAYLAKYSDFWPYVILVFSRADEISDEISMQREYLRSEYEHKDCPRKFRKVIDNVGGIGVGRYITVDSKNSSYREEIMSHLLQEIAKIKKERNEALYTNEMFKKIVKNHQTLTSAVAEKKNLKLIEEETKKGISGASCFPGDCSIITPNGEVQLKDLKIGDKVLTMVKGEMKFQKLITFLHYVPKETASYLGIHTDGAEPPIYLSSEHLIFVMSGQCTQVTPIYAKKVKPGDHILRVKQDSAKAGLGVMAVTQITEESNMAGIYAPLTTSGTIVVNGVVASCYSNVCSHSIAHISLAPLHCQILGGSKLYEGIHPYASFLMKLKGTV